MISLSSPSRLSAKFDYGDEFREEVSVGGEELNNPYSVSLAEVFFDLNLYFHFSLVHDFIFFETFFTLSGVSMASPSDFGVSTFSTP